MTGIPFDMADDVKFYSFSEELLTNVGLKVICSVKCFFSKDLINKI